MANPHAELADALRRAEMALGIYESMYRVSEAREYLTDLERQVLCNQAEHAAQRAEELAQAIRATKRLFLDPAQPSLLATVAAQGRA
ncbi:MAG TPA: hypothetical protein VE397_18190 [Stellaceae bacterium]|nr:hypothetical protein [Stellaceae bacterium]